MLEAYRERSTAICARTDARRKTDEVSVVIPQHGRSVDDGRVTSEPHRREQMLMEARNFFTKLFAEDKIFLPLQSTTVLFGTQLTV